MQTVGIIGGADAGNATSGRVALLAQKFTQSIQITIHTHENQ
ncbi:hypothetical protein [Spirosoma sp. KCTC 42546]|nr:hypothetical protein [Spirosoma sp. KCTC 42546]